MRVLVLCDDFYHPARVARAGLAPLEERGWSFDWIEHAGDWCVVVCACVRGGSGHTGRIRRQNRHPLIEELPVLEAAARQEQQLPRIRDEPVAAVGIAPARRGGEGEGIRVGADAG